MTEQEADIVKERLEKIWPVNQEGLVFFADEFSFTGVLVGQVRFACYCFGFGPRQDPYTVIISPYGEGYGTLHFNQGIIYDHIGGWRVDEEFVLRWLPVFRRGCWLSGCPLEATAHEKAEWMQGFRREELEAWNLKM